MKIIDLLNKIANGEEVPKKIKYRKCIFEYEEKYKDYFTKNGIIPTTFDTNGIFRNIFLNYNNFLNNEVEVIEDNKKIEKIDLSEWAEITYSKNWELLTNDFNRNCTLFVDKINEIIDKLNKEEDEEDVK